MDLILAKIFATALARDDSAPGGEDPFRCRGRPGQGGPNAAFKSMHGEVMVMVMGDRRKDLR
jgi:hypothetical protein